jgi:DNA-binding CsgD family transcriptional regulator
MSHSSAKPRQRVADEYAVRAYGIYAGGKLMREVAEEMGISPNWARVLIRRGEKYEKFRNQTA